MRGESKKKKKEKKTTTTERRNRVQEINSKGKKKILKSREYKNGRWPTKYYSVTILYHYFFKLIAT